MARVKFTRHLVRFFPNLGDNVAVNGRTVADVITNLNLQYPGLGAYIVDERGSLRKHVNVFVAGELISDRKTLSDPVQKEDKVYIFQALSGG
jgi:sulfur-carrier protein